MSQAKPVIKLYKGFASSKTTCIYGHVLRSASEQRDRPARNPFKNMLTMYHRYNVKPLRNVKVLLKIHGGAELEVKTSKSGFFFFRFETGEGLTEVEYSVSLSAYPKVSSEAVLEVQDPPFVVVSDIDDTLLISHSHKTFKKLYLLLTKNYKSRRVFDGIRGFYDDLLDNEEGKFFYVSSSEWNLYDFLSDFVSFNLLPNGVFLLQDLRSGIIDLVRSGGGSHNHKKDKIQTIIDAYPDSKLVLVGDSGQKDPYLYRDIALKNPHRIENIYIRDVRPSRRKKVRLVVDELLGMNIKMKLFRADDDRTG